VCRCRHRRGCHGRIGKSFQGSFTVLRAFKDLGRNTLSLHMPGKLPRKAITGSGEGYFHICDCTLTELIGYHGHIPAV
jgi:hypothetical protein